MNKILLVVEGTFDRAAPHIAGVAVAMSAALVVGVVILGLGLHAVVTVTLIIGLLVGLALLKARFAPPEMRIETFDDEEDLRIAGRFANANIHDKRSRDIARAVLEDNGDLRIELADEGEPKQVWLRQPAFRKTSLAMLGALIDDLRHLSRDEIRSEYDRSYKEIKVYNAKNLLLLRLTEKPSYMAMMWLISALTVLFWLALLPVLLGG